MGKKLKHGFWWRGGFIHTRDPVTGERTSTRCRDQAAAELWRAERERLAANPAYAASLKATVGGWAVKTMAHKESRRAKGTMVMYRIKLGHVVRLFGAGAPLATITPGAVDEFISTRSREGASNNTIHKELSCLWQMLKLAKRAREFAGDLDELKPSDFSAGYVPLTRALLRSDLPALWRALQNDTERAWVALALSTGADAADIERARPEDYDAERNVFRVRGTKTAVRDAEVPILPHVAELFHYALERLPVSWPRASKGVGDACRRAGIPHLSPKDLRRTGASWLAASGADISHISRYLRHSSDLMARKVYAQIKPEELGRLLLPSSSTIASQSVENIQRPLGGTADAEDLKADLVGEPSARNCIITEGTTAADCHELTRTAGDVGTNASQRTEADMGARSLETRTVVTTASALDSAVDRYRRAVICQLRSAGLLGARAPIGAEQEPSPGPAAGALRRKEGLAPSPATGTGFSPAAWGLAAAASRMGVL